ncbi:hypothetical protein BGZ80_008875 [Entomortierella chlamydospora]|uniref:Uncharacterized protein n=1 Tax=Entomortierella chlamydospora TaxID=101097 RepID=A0A9P6MYA9_9FUNG|nr:hypothetical protein BGZ80_008875 [Entomortierella chlamydospora]
MRCNDENEDSVEANTNEARLELALQHEDWAEADWKQVIWSGESTINRISSDGMRYVWAQADNEPKVKAADIDPELAGPTVRHGGESR